MGLYPHPGRGERPALKGEDKGFREYKVATLELLPQTENIFPVYKEGWHNPETHAREPARRAHLDQEGGAHVLQEPSKRRT